MVGKGEREKELLGGRRYVVLKCGEKWRESERERGEVVFERYGDVKEGYWVRD